MRRGPKPKPTAVKRRQGNPGHRPLNHDEPDANNRVPPVPAMLTDTHMRDEWTRITKELRAEGRLHSTHMVVLAGYCYWWGKWCSLCAQVGDKEVVTMSPSKHDIEFHKAQQKALGKSDEEIAVSVARLRGKPVPHPALRARDAAWDKTLRCAVEIGVTPSSQTRVKVDGNVPLPPIEGENVASFEDFIAEGKRKRA